MIQHIWTIPCRVSITDRETNNISMIEVLEEITLPTALEQQPDSQLVPAIFDVITLWGRQNDETPESGFGRFQLVSPSGEALMTYEYDVDLQVHQRRRILGRLIGFPLVPAGKYRFQVERRHDRDAVWEIVATIPIAIRHGQVRAEPSGNGHQPEAR